MRKGVKIKTSSLQMISGGNAAGAAAVAVVGCLYKGAQWGAQIAGFWGGVVGGVVGTGACAYVTYTASS